MPALKPGDIPLQWSHDGRYVYTVDRVGGVGRRTLRYFASSSRPAPACFGRRSASRLRGSEGLRPTVVITPDARSYCYSYMRRLGDLFVVDGLK